MASSYTMIFAAEPGGSASEGDVGHCWVAVECPKKTWTVRGFYPDSGAFLSGTVGALGIIKDDRLRFKDDAYRLRTRTQRGLSEQQVRAALKFMFAYGASARLGKPLMPRPGHAVQYSPAPDMHATHGWSVAHEQCAWFAVDTCKAAGFSPVPYNTPRLPWKCHEALGKAGQIDAKNLPAPFGKGPP